MWDTMYDDMCSPERCSLLIISLSRQMTFTELKHPFQMATQLSARAPLSVPSMVTKKSFLTTRDTRPAIMTDIGRSFQSF